MHADRPHSLIGGASAPPSSTISDRATSPSAASTSPRRRTPVAVRAISTAGPAAAPLTIPSAASSYPRSASRSQASR